MNFYPEISSVLVQTTSRGVRYAKFQSIRYFIDIDILQILLVDIDIDINIFQKC